MRTGLGALTLLAAAMLILQVADAEPESVRARLIREKAATVVSVKAVLKIKLTSKEGVREAEYPVSTAGTVVHASGLVMVPRTMFDAYFYYDQKRFSGYDVSTEPTNVRTIFPGDTKEYASVFVAKDTGLGLGFVQIEDAGQRKIEAVDIAGDRQPDMNTVLHAVLRMGSQFDFAPICVDLRLVGKLTKPRTMWLIRGEGSYDLNGCDAIYDGACTVVGVCIHHKGVGGVGDYEPFLVKAPTARQVIARALKRAKTELERLREAKEEQAETEDD